MREFKQHIPRSQALPGNKYPEALPRPNPPTNPTSPSSQALPGNAYPEAPPRPNPPTNPRSPQWEEVDTK